MATANAEHRAREARCWYDTDGTVVIQARLPAEQAALVMKALELAMERREIDMRAALRSTEAVSDKAASCPREPFDASRVDALVEVAESYLNHGATSATTADRHQVVVHVSAETSKDDGDVSAETSAHINAGASHIEDGPHVSVWYAGERMDWNLAVGHLFSRGSR